MRYENTVAYFCTYGDDATHLFEGWYILVEDSEADYQGHAAVLAEKDGLLRYLSWEYGSCSGCDEWEATEADVPREMDRLCMTMTKEEFINHFKYAEKSSWSSYSARDLLEKAGLLPKT